MKLLTTACANVRAKDIASVALVVHAHSDFLALVVKELRLGEAVVSAHITQPIKLKTPLTGPKM